MKIKHNLLLFGVMFTTVYSILNFSAINAKILAAQTNPEYEEYQISDNPQSGDNNFRSENSDIVSIIKLISEAGLISGLTFMFAYHTVKAMQTLVTTLIENMNKMEKSINNLVTVQEAQAKEIVDVLMKLVEVSDEARHIFDVIKDIKRDSQK